MCNCDLSTYVGTCSNTLFQIMISFISEDNIFVNGSTGIIASGHLFVSLLFVSLTEHEK
jgi:hypothetical protein